MIRVWWHCLTHMLAGHRMCHVIVSNVRTRGTRKLWFCDCGYPLNTDEMLAMDSTLDAGQ